MQIFDTISRVRALRWADPAATWGLVPTMGYLHEGHLSLVRQSVLENDLTAATIYVNPTQFAPDEDLSTYPRDAERDLALLAAEGVDMVFMPTDATMYPAGFQTEVRLSDVTQMLEGASRPTHLHGVATVVTKLLNIVQPTRAYFGQKDAQQTVVIKRLVADLNIATEIVICPIVREPDGLALSSRNVYLSAEQRAAATILSRSVQAIAAALDAGERDAAPLRTQLAALIAAEPLARCDYVSIAHPLTLQELATIDDTALISLAVFFGKTRLIDNILWTENL